MPITIDLPLDLPDVQVLTHRVLEDGTRLIEVESTLQTAQCHRCSREIDRFHGSDQPIQLRHLPCSVVRESSRSDRSATAARTVTAGRPRLSTASGMISPARLMKAFEAWVLKWLVHRTVAAFSRRLDLGVKAMEGIMAYPLTPPVDWVCKGQGHDVAVVWVRDARRHPHVLTVLSDRLQATVRHGTAVLYRYVGRLCERAVMAALPQSQLGVDRFHVAVQYRDTVEALRKQEWHRLNTKRGLANPLPITELRRLFRREWPSLTPAQQGQLGELFGQSPTLVSACSLRILLTAIFERTPDRATAQTRLQARRAQVKALGMPCFDKFLHTLQNWQDKIINDFEGRYTSGFVEGLNNKLKRLKRRCFGLDDPIELFRRLRLDIEGAWF